MKANAEPRLLSSLVWIDSDVVVSQHRLESFLMKKHVTEWQVSCTIHLCHVSQHCLASFSKQTNINNLMRPRHLSGRPSSRAGWCVACQLTWPSMLLTWSLHQRRGDPAPQASVNKWTWYMGQIAVSITAPGPFASVNQAKKHMRCAWCHLDVRDHIVCHAMRQHHPVTSLHAGKTH